MEKAHHYATTLTWTGNRGKGTTGYTAYDRDHLISMAGKPDIQGSSDPGFRGDPSRHNPEELLVASLSACHMLWYLHLSAEKGVVVTAYFDAAKGTMMESKDGSGRFTEVALHPVVTVTDETMREEAHALHDRAHEMCFIARSVNFSVIHRPEIKVVANQLPK